MTTPRPASRPGIRTHDIEGFQERRDAFLETAPTPDLSEAVYRVCRQFEDWSEQGMLHSGHELHDFVNNGTSMLVGCTAELRRRLEAREAKVRELERAARELAAREGASS